MPELEGENDGFEDTMETNPVEPNGDQESAKKNIAQALVDLCGGVEAACDCLNSLGVGEELPEEGVLDEEPLVEEEPITDELGEMPAEMPSEMPAIM